MGRQSTLNLITWFFGFCGLVILDQLTKVLAFRITPVYIGNFISLQHFDNNAFAFSFPVPIALAYGIYAAVLIGIGWYVAQFFHKMSRLHQWFWLLIIAGAVSNVGERIMFGSVRDFIGITTGVFNLADFYIMIGAVGLLIIKRPLT